MSAPTLRSVVERSWRDNLLFSVLVELTYRCNLDCFFCYNDLGLKGQPLTTAQYLGFFADLRDLQVLNLTLTGGEPLAHPDFFRLGAAARELGFVVRVKSNGHALNGTLARRLREEVDPYQVEVSLHGATAATHDRQTRVAGSFERLLANLAEMKKLGLRIKVNSTLTAWNEHEVGEMFALTDRLELPIQFDPEVTPRDDGSREPLSISPSRDGVLRLFRLQFERGDAAGAASAAPAPPEVMRQADADLPPPTTGKHCGAGSSGIAVDPYGNVYPCVQWRRPAGNLHQQRIAEIWARSRGLADVRELTQVIQRRLAAHGPEAALLNFCPGQAEATTGDPAAIYDGAKQRAELLQQVMDERQRSPLRVLR